MSDLEVRQLRYFVAVAEELHFGRAAERLRMAQPPLSRAIRDLERQLGVDLFERTTRQVRLTGAGEVLLRDARTALDAVGAAAARARHAGRESPTLRLALKADFDAGLLPAILAEFRAAPEAVEVDVLLGGRGEQLPALRDGRADVALLLMPFRADDMAVEELLTEPQLVALPVDDPLVRRDDLTLADLAGRELPDGSPAEEGGRLNGRPRRGLDLTQIFNLIELGSFIMFTPESVARRYPRPGIAYRPVRGLRPATLSVVWPEDSRAPAVAAFVRAASRVAGELPRPAAPPLAPAFPGVVAADRP